MLFEFYFIKKWQIIKLDQLEEAKSALCEANILNNKAPEVWAYLSLICLKTDKPLEAEQAYKYAIKLNLDNPELLEEIHSNIKIIYSIDIKTIISNLFFIKIFKIIISIS